MNKNALLSSTKTYAASSKKQQDKAAFPPCFSEGMLSPIGSLPPCFSKGKVSLRISILRCGELLLRKCFLKGEWCVARGIIIYYQFESDQS